MPSSLSSKRRKSVLSSKTRKISSSSSKPMKLSAASSSLKSVPITRRITAPTKRKPTVRALMSELVPPNYSNVDEFLQKHQGQDSLDSTNLDLTEEEMQPLLAEENRDRTRYSRYKDKNYEKLKESWRKSKNKINERKRKENKERKEKEFLQEFDD